ncbi:MAG: hypothetical protein ACRD2C_23785 [Acidimicrobiales bacterium]
MLEENVSLRDWLKANSRINELHQEMMMLRYDLDGSLDAGQVGLTWWAQENILICGAHLYLEQSGIGVPYQEDRLDRGFRVMEALARVNPRLGEDAWRLWLRDPPSPERLEGATARTLEFVTQSLDLSWAMSRGDVVIRWASNTRILRIVAGQFGIARSDDWYLTSSQQGSSDADWYDEVLAMMAEENEGTSAE